MSTRRHFLQRLGAVTALSAASPQAIAASRRTAPPEREPDMPGEDRTYWAAQLIRVAEPVLSNMAANKLKQKMPVESPASKPETRRPYTHLEALGRTLVGLAPWLELQDKSGPEAEASRKVAQLARQSVTNAIDPEASDRIDFTAGAQCLVDSAFLAHAFIRSRTELWEKLDPAVRGRVVDALKSTRKFTPGANNWFLFSAMIEAFLASTGAEWNEQPIQTALDAHEQWYKGDGVYGDGPEFHWDYYNSFVIQPMLIDVLEQVGRVTPKWSELLPMVLARAQRFAEIQERLVAIDGSFPVIGRSIVYRCGAFQLLAQMALRNQLPKSLAPAQVRGALSAVIVRTLDAPNTFDRNGWLRIGLAGQQPGLAESYISTGSLYLCTAAFLPLGLPANNPFWSGRQIPWTARRAWGGQDIKADHALKAV